MELQSGNEHQQQDTKFREVSDDLTQVWVGKQGPLQEVQQGRTQYQADQDFACNGRLPQPLAQIAA